ncbi:OmpA family protein [Xenorhabdus entomophaga]|uniref:OmpA family protein n=1 Tax=Xenorhabdus entomophaga TaxID=3136257 RepID=UPI0030F3AB0E
MSKSRSFIFICTFICTLFLSACQNNGRLTTAQIAALKQQGFQQTDEGCLFGIHHARLDGHTDNYGEVSYNNQLSLKRANTVAEALTQGGMQRTHLTTRGLGPDQPIADNRSSKGRAENRRVAIVITAP